LSPEHRRAWLELAAAVEHLGCYAASDLPTFKLAARVVAFTEDKGLSLPPTAAVRLMQVAAGLLAQFGLSPASRGRVETTRPGEVDHTEAFLFQGVGAVFTPKPS
jgi:hypothetical protein